MNSRPHHVANDGARGLSSGPFCMDSILGCLVVRLPISRPVKCCATENVKLRLRLKASGG